MLLELFLEKERNESCILILKKQIVELQFQINQQHSILPPLNQGNSEAQPNPTQSNPSQPNPTQPNPTRPNPNQPGTIAHNPA